MARAIRLERQRLGRRIRKFREDRGLTQERVAELAGVHAKHIPRIESGSANVTIATLVALSRALNVDLYSFFEID